MSNILVIDDNDGVRTALEVLLSIHQLNVHSASTPEEGLTLLRQQEFNLVIQDMNFSRNITSGEEGVDLFHQIRAIDPDIPIVIITAWTNLETAIELVKDGASDYLQKPWDDSKLIIGIKNLLQLESATREQQQVVANRNRARRELEKQYDLCGLVFNSEAMIKLVTLATQVAKADVPVLITGPNGCGKEKFAEIIQANSFCQDGPFVKVNAGALPRDLMESELFGANEGAYTGARKDRIGRFESADKGTLFLDEIGNLPVEGQIKLLRVIQTGEFERLGSSETRKVNVRLVCATNTPLQEAVDRQEFRQDLLYRINVIQLAIPPLSERPDDILPLAQSFLDGEKTLSTDAKKALLSYHWPGNVRELQNCIQRAMLLSPDSEINSQGLGLTIDASQLTKRPLAEMSTEVSAAEITQVLAEHKGVIARAARDLGMSRQALYRRIKKFGIEHE